MFRERMIVAGSLRIDADSYQFSARIPWYRALPLSCIENVEVALDGVPAAPDALRLIADGIELSLPETQELSDRAWYVLDDLVIRVAGVSVEVLDSHGVDLTLGVRIPYLPVEGRPLVVVEHFRTTLAGKESAA